MTSSSFVLERLPPEIFEDLVYVTHGERDDEEITTSGVLLQRRICNKLKSFPRKIAGRIRYKNVARVDDFLKISEIDLVHGLDPLLTFVECKKLRQRICQLCAAKPCTVFSLIRRSETNHRGFVTSGIPALDNQLLQGGFRVGSVTEIYGSAGSGKTNLALQICLEVAKRGMAAAFIETEGKFSLERLHELAFARNDISTRDQTNLPRSKNSRERAQSPESRQRAMDTLSRILLYSASGIDKLRGVITAVEVEACVRNDRDGQGSTNKHPIEVIVLDSIAAPARREFGKGEVAARAQSLMQFAKSLKRLAEKLQLAVIVINQIGGTGFRRDNEANGNDIHDTAGALGNSWHHCATTRLLVECKTTSDASYAGRMRQITVIKSSVLKRGSTALLCLGQDGFENAM